MRYEVEYPERLSRWKTAFRLPLFIPVALFLYVITAIVNAVFPAGWIAVFLRRSYPRWLFVAASGALGFLARAQAYALLLTDRYPGFDATKSPVTLEYDDPPGGYLSRWRVFFWKGILLIPHLFVLWFLSIAVFVVVFLAWFAILFTGRYPRGMFGFVTGSQRWTFRLAGYFASFNDRYPPFAFSANAGPASTTSSVIGGVMGWIGVGLVAAFVGVAIAVSQNTDNEAVDYGRLAAGSDAVTTTYENFRGGITYELTLRRAFDPAGDLARILSPGAGQRLVAFEWTLRDGTPGSITITGEGFKLKYEDDGGERHTVSEELLVVDGSVAPVRMEGGGVTTIRAIFVIPADATPVELRFKASFTPGGGVKYALE